VSEPTDVGDVNAASAANAANGANAGRETRDRLLESAARLFAERGYDKVGVREICAEARANLAAVNYYFGDKRALYRAVLGLALSTMRETNELSMEAGRGGAPDEQLRAYVRVFLTRMATSDRSSWIHRLMAREMEQPTELLDTVLRDVVAPRHRYLSDVLARIAGVAADDIRVLRGVASIHAQMLTFARPLPANAPAEWRAMAADIEGTIEHIVRFSIGGIRAL
jgi:AcrR family transcriptional regulator